MKTIKYNRIIRNRASRISLPIQDGMWKRRPSLSKLLIIYIVFNMVAFFLMLQRIENVGDMSFLYGEKHSDIERSRRALSQRKARYFR